MNPVVHFEMPYEDASRLSDFYAKSFGWKIEVLKEMGDYAVAMTTEMDEKDQFPKEAGRINGGFFKKSPEIPAIPSVVIAVDDIKESMKKVEEAGGTIIGAQKPGEPDDIPGIGLYISFKDTEGNRVSMLQPKGM